MHKPSNPAERIEWARRRLERAKRIVEDGLIKIAQTSDGPLYLCRSQTGKEKEPEKAKEQEQWYVVGREECPCQDRFQLEGQKLCKHILARLLLEEDIPLKEIGKEPCYWERAGGKAGRDGRRTPSKTKT
jgi:hypothetical protein